MEEGADARSDARRCGVVLTAVYVALAGLILTEQLGRRTSDTRMELTEDPAGYLAATFSLWNPQVSLGELQNQAYGYLFPQGLWFALLDGAGVPGWLSQRLWSVLVLVVACEGVRRLARALSIGSWAAAVAGLGYGLAPRHLAELGVRSAEILPGAVLPWALLPIVQAVEGRRRPRDAAVLSAAAFACGGGVNGTATAAPVALLAIVVGWAVLRRRLTWRFAAGWAALIVAVNVWWAGSLLRLGAYSPPFFDYVEDASTTTTTSGFAASLRGASNWVAYLDVGGARWWPAGYTVSFAPWVVLGSGVVAALAFVGLLRWRSPWRVPMLVAAALGLLCQVAAHTGPLDGPLSQWLQDLLDGSLAPLRNVPKADPILRVPLAIGLAVVVSDLIRTLVRRRSRWRRAGAGGLVGAVALGLVAMVTPIAQAETRTPGWDALPAYWDEAAEFLADRRAERLDGDAEHTGAASTWLIPGSGFGIQTWGWTMEEPLQAVARSPWVTRSQVPLTPAQTIRMLSALEVYLETGAGSPYLAAMLTRVGVDTVLVRHDLDPAVSLATPSNLVAVALARSPGLRRIATFGRLDFGPAIEVFSVRAPGASTSRTTATTGGYDVRDVDDTVTVASSVEDAIAAVGAGLVRPDQAMVLAGTPGWGESADDPGADVVGDGYRRRERAFGRVHDAESNVMAVDDPYHGDRVVPDYPGPPGAEPVVADYDGIAGVTASSSRGWADALGQLRPENAPWSALDGDASTYWQPAPFHRTTGQWLTVRFDEPTEIDEVALVEPVAASDLHRVGRWRVIAGDTERVAEVDPLTGTASVDLDGAVAEELRVEVATGDPSASFGLTELRIDGVEPSRTLLLPEVDLAPDPFFLFSARPEARPCITTLLGPDCDRGRQRAAEEAAGLDRTFTLDDDGRWRVAGLVVARARPGTVELLDPLGPRSVTASSWLGEDPTVGPRMAYDDDPATSWIADPRDPSPTLTVDLGRARELRRIVVTRPTGSGARPQTAVLVAGEEEREVDLDGVGAFEPLTTRHLAITFPGAAGDVAVGVGELRLLSGRVARPLDGGGPTGSVCGYGPTLEVDGRAIPTKVTGNVGAVVSAGQLAVRPCGKGGRGPVDLDAGAHRVRLLSTEQFQPVSLGLTPVDRPEGADGDGRRSRTVRLVAADDTRVVLDVDAGEDAIVSAPHNVNAGWVATVDGHELEPIVVDGWAQGWLLPEDLSGEVELTYAPQRGYLTGLVAGLVLLALVLLWAAVILGAGLARRLRGRTTTARADESADPSVESDLATTTEHRGPPRTRAVLVTGLLCVGVAGLFGGPVVAAGAAAGIALHRWRDVVHTVVAVALVAAVVMTVAGLADGPRFPTAPPDLVTGAAVALGLSAAALDRRGRRRPEGEPGARPVAGSPTEPAAGP